MRELSSRTCLLFVVVFLFAAGSLAQGPPEPRAATFLGSVADSTYTNDNFGFSLNFPKDWLVADAEMTAAVTKIGVDVVKGKSESDNKRIQDSLKQEVVLLHVTKKPVGALDNAMLIVVVRKQASPALTPAMLAEATKSAFDSSPVMKLIGNTRMKTLAGRNFALLDYEMNVSGQRATIRLLITMVNDYALSFTISYPDDASGRELEKALDSLKFSGR